jgi:hypothetical protein
MIPERIKDLDKRYYSLTSPENCKFDTAHHRIRLHVAMARMALFAKEASLPVGERPSDRSPSGPAGCAIARGIRQEKLIQGADC